MASFRAGKILVLVLITLIVLLVVGVFLPAIAAATVGRGIVADAVAAQVDGTVVVDSVAFSWGSPQRVHGLHIIDRSGREAADVDVTFASGLLPIVLGSIDDYTVGLTGALHGTLRPDGSTSFTTLLAREADDNGADGTPPPPSRAPAAATSAAGPGSVRIDLQSLVLSLALEDADGVDRGEAIVLGDLTGHVELTPGAQSSVDLASPTTSGGAAGRIAITVDADRLIGTGGSLSARGARLNAAIRADTLAIPFDDGGRRLTRMELSLAARDLADEVTLVLIADTEGNGETSTLRGNLTLDDPVRDDGSLHVELGTIRGDVSGERVPTALLQAAVAGLPVVLARDLGSTVDVSATFAPLSEDAAAGSRVGVTLTSEPHASLEFVAGVSPDGAVDGGALDARMLVQPALVASIVDSPGGPVLMSNVPLHLHLDSFGLPAPGPDGLLLSRLAFDGTLACDDTLDVALAGDAGRRLTARSARLALSTAALGDEVHVKGGAEVLGGRLEIDERISKLLDAEDAFDPRRLAPIGEISLRGIDGAIVASMLGLAGADPARPAMERTLAGELTRGPLDLVVTTEPRNGDLAGQVELTSGTTKATLKAERNAARLTLVPAVEFTLRPDHLAVLLAEGEKPIALAAPVRAAIRGEAFELPAGIFDDAGNLPDVPVRAKFVTDVFRLERPGAETVKIDGLAVDLGASLRGASDLTIKAGARVQRDDGTPVGVIGCDLVASTGGDRIAPRGTVSVTDIAVPAVEAVLGMEPDTLAGWTGTPGALTLVLTEDPDRRKLATSCVFPNLSGDANVSLAGDDLRVDSDGLRMTMRRAMLERLLNAPPGDDPSASSTRVAVAEDVPMTLTIERGRLPLTLASGVPVTPGGFDLKASLSGGPIKLTDAAGIVSTLDTLTINVTSGDLAQGIDFTVDGESSAPTVADRGVIDIDGRVIDVLTPESVFTIDDAKLDMSAKARGVPTMLADAALGLQQLLVAALGAEMESTFTTKRFSRSTGRVDTSIVTSNGDLAGSLEARPGLLVSVDDAMLQGSLDVTPPLRERLLKKIHPVLADIRTLPASPGDPTPNRLRFRITGPTQVPTDGDVGKLNGDMQITIGDVMFKAGAKTLGLLGLFIANPNQDIPGSIEPIVVHFRNGVVTYDRFAVHIDKYTLLYQGRIDLTTKTVDLRTELPLKALGKTFEEAAGYVDRVVVPIVTRGPLDNPKTEIDPQFDLGKAAIDAGVGGLINDALKDKKLDGVGGLIGDILGGGKERQKGNEKDKENKQ